MTTDAWITVIAVAILFTPLGLVKPAMRWWRAHHTQPATVSPIAQQASEHMRRGVPGARSRQPLPDGFAPLTGGALTIEAGNVAIFTASNGIVLHKLTPLDAPGILIAHDGTLCGSPVTCCRRSPDLPAYGGWSDWLIELDAIRATGRALAELTLADLRAITAFTEYGQTQRARQNGAHRA
ncbi:hypothetical protein [Demequina gelatinilytica]|uniref:hypothetical protein n=1 Tax=Demequina gelatinilytica TaxID=1638980 RepID=UPI0007804505|nr:hypothetical protein [Demequina gelatinilytica]